MNDIDAAVIEALDAALTVAAITALIDHPHCWERRPGEEGSAPEGFREMTAAQDVADNALRDLGPGIARAFIIASRARRNAIHYHTPITRRAVRKAAPRSVRGDHQSSSLRAIDTALTNYDRANLMERDGLIDVDTAHVLRAAWSECVGEV